MWKVFASIFFMLEEMLLQCTAGCLKCSSSNTCLVCDSTSLYVRVGNSCIKNSLNYCALSFTVNACSLCIPGYYLEVNRKCVLNTKSSLAIANCYSYSSMTRCGQCQKYYYLSNGGKQCLRVTNIITKCQVYNSTTTCAICADSIVSNGGKSCTSPQIIDDNCLFYSNMTVCNECRTGYWLNDNMYLTDIQNSFENFMILKMNYLNTFNVLTSVQKCDQLQIVSNCAFYDPITNQCTKCVTEFYLNQTSFQCVSNPVQTKPISSILIPYCYMYQTNYKILNGINTTVITCNLCYQGYFLSINGNKCTKHTSMIANCLILSQTTNSVCLLCTQNYYLNLVNNVQVCSPRQTLKNCLMNDPMSNQCLICTNPTYIKYYNNMYCAPPIANCVTLNLDTDPLTCTNCAITYYFNTVTNTCILNNNFDPYCTLYDSNQLCIQCTFGYYYESILKACTANTAEYVSRSQCQTFVQNIKDTCQYCSYDSILISVNNTCKIPPTTLSNNIISQILNCNTYYIDYQGNYICSLAQVYTPNNIPCDATLSTCIPNSLNLQTNLAVPITNKLAYCITYAASFNGGSQVSCIQCQSSIYFIDLLYTPDICAKESVIPWCLDKDRPVSDSPICVIPQGYCTLLYYGATGNSSPDLYSAMDLVSTCLSCPLDTTIVPNCFNTCNIGSVSTSKCYMKNGVWMPSSGSKYLCNTIPSSTISPNTACTSYKDNVLSCGVGAVYQVRVQYSITLAPDSSQCIVENIYFDPSKVCLFVKNFSCLLCIRGYYPTLKTNIPFVQDYVESYYSVLSYQNMNNCMMYDNTLNQCIRCDYAATGNRLNSYGTCVPCSSSSYATNPSYTLCISFYSSTLIAGSCEKVDNHLTSTPCLRCASGYMQIYSFIMDYTNLLIDVDFIYSAFNVPSYIANTVNGYEVNECVPKSNLFVSSLSYAAQNANCDWGYMVAKVYYCLKCSFGYAGMLSVTSSNVYYLQNCTPNLSCNANMYITFNLTSVRYYLSCHICNNPVNIPTLYMYNDYAVSASNVKFLFSSTTGDSPTTFQCVLKNRQLPPSCAAQIYITDSILLTKIQGISWLCLSCLPSYYSTNWVPIVDGSYPYFYTTGCNLIQNCADSNVTNTCQQCLPFYNLVNNGTSCVRDPLTNPELQYCNVIQQIGSNYACSQCMNGYKNLQVATNSQLPLYQCLPYITSNCKYYSVDQCIQSTKNIGVGYNILIRRLYMDYYINQSTCISAQSFINNCLFYLNSTSCYICNSGYFVGGPISNYCYQQNVPNCVSYNSVTTKCIVCSSGYTLTQSSCIETVTPNIQIPFCVKYSGSYCSECTVNYTPIIVANGQTSVCISNVLSNLCEVVNTDGIKQNNVVSCLQCKTLSSIIASIAANTLKLDQFDFVSINDYQTYLSSGTISYPSTITSQAYLRAAITLQPLNTQYCLKFGSVANCQKYDSVDLTHTFICTACTLNKYYLSNGNCYPITPVSNCITYNPNSNSCLTYLDTSTSSFTYSVKDLAVISMNIPTFPGFNTNPSSIQGCVAFSNSVSCSMCNSTMWLYNNLCLTVKTQVSNCKVYSSDGICSECTAGLLLKQNKCLITYATNCDGYLTSTKCLRCPKKYPILDISGSCVANVNVQNCKLYENPNYCYQCTQTFVNSNGVCTFGALILNCLNNYNNECRECALGYFISSDKKSCIPNPNYDRNCVSFVNKYVCVVCRERFYMLNGECVKCETDQLSCYMCYPNNPNLCLMCSPGFFMDASGNCQIVLGYVSPMILLLNQNNQLASTVGS